MENSRIDVQIQRLAIEGVVLNDDEARREGIAPFLWKMSQVDHLSYTGKERDYPLAPPSEVES